MAWFDVIYALIISLASGDIPGGDTTVAGVQLPTPLLWLLAIAALATAAHTVWNKAVKPVARVMRQIHATYEKVMEYDDRLGVVEKHAKELVNNSGSSLRDAVDRIEEGINDNTVRLNDHILWAEGERAELWKTIAAHGVIDSANETAKQIERGENG